MNKKAILAAWIQSYTDPTKRYELKIRDGVVSCSCPAWRFNLRGTNPRTCKHIDVFQTADGLEKMLAFSGKYNIVIEGKQWTIEKKNETTV
jgi:predicted nucleic acid-binding Zn finger protein